MTEPNEFLLELVRARRQITVGDLVGEFSKGQGVRVDAATRMLYQLWDERKVALEDPYPPVSLMRYAFSLYSLWFWLLALVVALTMFSIYVLPQGPPFIYLRYCMGAISVLYVPGAALIEALYPKKQDLEELERLALSVGLSLALVPLAGLVLNYTPWGIRLDPVFVSLSLLTFGLAVLAVYRKFGYFMMAMETREIVEDRH